MSIKNIDCNVNRRRNIESNLLYLPIDILNIILSYEDYYFVGKLKEIITIHNPIVYLKMLSDGKIVIIDKIKNDSFSLKIYNKNIRLRTIIYDNITNISCILITKCDDIIVAVRNNNITELIRYDSHNGNILDNTTYVGENIECLYEFDDNIMFVTPGSGYNIHSWNGNILGTMFKLTQFNLELELKKYIGLTKNKQFYILDNTRIKIYKQSDLHHYKNVSFLIENYNISSIIPTPNTQLIFSTYCGKIVFIQGNSINKTVKITDKRIDNITYIHNNKLLLNIMNTETRETTIYIYDCVSDTLSSNIRIDCGVYFEYISNIKNKIFIIYKNWSNDVTMMIFDTQNLQIDNIINIKYYTEFPLYSLCKYPEITCLRSEGQIEIYK